MILQTFGFKPLLVHPFNLVCDSPSQAGKTHWIAQLLLQKGIITFPKKIFLIYSYDAQVYHELQSRISGMTLIQGIPINIAEEEFTDKTQPSLIIIDGEQTLTNILAINPNIFCSADQLQTWIKIY